MNRAERRRLKREAYKDDPIYLVKGSDMSHVADKYAKRATDEAFAYMLGVVVEVMHEEFDWGVEDCNWMVDKMVEHYNNAKSIDHLVKQTKELSGMVIEFDN